jgi:hypothetical protein
MFLHKQCELLSRLSGIEYHSPNVPTSGIDARRLLTDKEIWRTRHDALLDTLFVDVPNMEYEIILHLRDQGMSGVDVLRTVHPSG